MLSRTQRLSTAQLEFVMEKGRVFHSSLFLVRVLGGQKSTRIAAVAPKKIAPTATIRNATRRKVYTALKEFVGKIGAGNHIVLIAKPTVVNAGAAIIGNDLASVFVKAGLLV